MTPFASRFSGTCIALLLLGGCRTANPGETATAGDTAGALQGGHHQNLNSTLWMQTSAEYQASARQAYRLAAVMLDSALADSDRTACVNQIGKTDFRELPPAIILDVDETVLDNSPYQAWLIEQDREYDRASWNEWVRMEVAEPVPGALEFTQQAASRGVAVFYITNRRAEVEGPTRSNLERLGFPLRDTEDVLLTRGERPESEDRDKQSRRDRVMTGHRCLLLIGDDLADFVSGARGTVSERRELVAKYEGFWGSRWIVLPNPQYGSWDEALFEANYSLSDEARRARKRAALRLPAARIPE